MTVLDLYTIPQCGFCSKLKALLKEKAVDYRNHDISSDPKALAEMQALSEGNMSVPVLVFDKGQDGQKVSIGYPAALDLLRIEDKEHKEGGAEQTAMLTCPKCGYKQEGAIPTTACVPFYVCNGCKQTIQAEGKDCCVFCSYADKKCPLKSDDAGCEGGVCKI